VVNGVASEQAKPELFIFDEDRLVISVGKEKQVGTYRFVESDEGPKMINLVDDQGNITRGIYEFEGDTMRLCLQDPQGTERPTSFASSAENKTTRLTLKQVPPPFSDYQRIQGAWRLISKLDDGNPVEVTNSKTHPATYVFRGSKLIRNDGTEKLDTDFYLDHSLNQISLINEDWKLTRGYYELTGETLQISLSKTEHYPPRSFDAASDSEVIVLTLRRVTDETGQARCRDRLPATSSMRKSSSPSSHGRSIPPLRSS
jgi:uncharacterized protein (TIGR03067 family)